MVHQSTFGLAENNGLLVGAGLQVCHTLECTGQPEGECSMRDAGCTCDAGSRHIINMNASR